MIKNSPFSDFFDSSSAVLRETFTSPPPPPPQKIDQKYKIYFLGVKLLAHFFPNLQHTFSDFLNIVCTVISQHCVYFLNIVCTFSTLCTFLYFLNILCTFLYFLNIKQTFSTLCSLSHTFFNIWYTFSTFHTFSQHLADFFKTWCIFS